MQGIKQFNLSQLIFDDPIVQFNEDGEPIGHLTYGDDWYLIETQEAVNLISSSITGGGAVWEENGKLLASGSAPSEYHQWKNGKWEIREEIKNRILSENKLLLLQRIADKTDFFKAQLLAGYSQAEIDSFYRQEREARNELPLMLLTEIFEGRDDLDSIEQLKGKVIEKAEIFAIIMGKLFAIKQRFEKRIEVALTAEELSKIDEEIEQWQKA